jgi:hypothetical protein
MRITLALALLVLIAVRAAAGPLEGRGPLAHVRPLTPSAAELLDRAASRSAIVRAQLEQLERTDVVVYVVDSMSGSGGEIRALLEFVSCAAGIRYLVVRIDRWRLAPNDAVAWLGHELQHAMEIAADTSVRSAAQMARLYRTIGWEGPTGQFETEQARKAGHHVLNELVGFRQ